MNREIESEITDDKKEFDIGTYSLNKKVIAKINSNIILFSLFTISVGDFLFAVAEQVNNTGWRMLFIAAAVCLVVIGISLVVGECIERGEDNEKH